MRGSDWYWPTDKTADLLHPPSHVRVLNSEDLIGYCRASDEDDWPEPPDAWDTTTDTTRDAEVTITFDVGTDLEFDLAVTAITEFVTRRVTSLQDPVFIARYDNYKGEK